LTRPLISLCMIVKNAEKTLGDVLYKARAAFDEIVIVDTGSTDGTVALARGMAVADGKGESVYHFKWSDDFAAARNYAFSLATGTWRMYLDADDILHASHLLPHKLNDLVRRFPNLNAVSMDYEYVKGQSKHQKIRLVRWLDDDGKPLGWTWKDRIHEYLDLPGRQKVVATLLSGHEGDIYVEHMPKSDEDTHAAFERNARLLNLTMDDIGAPADERGRAAFHLGLMTKSLDRKTSLRHFTHAAVLMPGTSFEVYAGLEKARIYCELKDYAAARGEASDMHARFPEFPLAQKTLAYVHAVSGDLSRAALHFEPHFTERTLSSMTPAPYEDVLFEHVVLPTYAGTAFLAAGNVELAERAFAAVDEDAARQLAVSDTVLFLLREGRAKLMQHEGARRLIEYADYLLWQTEPVKALSVLANLPSTLRDMPQIRAKRDWLKARLGHLKGWEQYKEHYASIPPETYHTPEDMRASTLALARAQNLLAWAKALPHDKPVRVLAIGAQDCVIEDAIMEACPAIEVTVCDVAPQASKGIRELRQKYGDRVKTHVMVGDEADWCPNGATYDAIVMFEVIEHLSRPADFTLEMLSKRLRMRGELFLSCPVAHRWIEPYLTSDTGPAWFGHVRALDYRALTAAASDGGFFIESLTEEFDGTFFLHARKAPEAHWQREGERFTFVVPNTPHPFNALSHHEGFVGGSEEAVIHLATSLSQNALALVEVYAPVPQRYPVRRVHKNVQWHDINAFEQPRPDEMPVSNIVYWRCPHLVVKHTVESPYKQILWLHDAAYGARAEAYENADIVLVLSDAHAEALRRNDGVTRALTMFQNGIDEAAFPAPDETRRDKHRVIYSSSPDRGLEEVLAAWPSIRRRFPDAVLDIFYDWTYFRQRNPQAAYALETTVASLQDLGVTYHGGVSHDELHAAMRRSAVWLYPTHGDVETSCITAMKAAACGCTPVVTDAGALLETLKDASPLILENTSPQMIADTVAKAFKETAPARERRHENMINRFSWSVTAKKLVDIVA